MSRELTQPSSLMALPIWVSDSPLAYVSAFYRQLSLNKLCYTTHVEHVDSALPGGTHELRHGVTLELAGANAEHQHRSVSEVRSRHT